MKKTFLITTLVVLIISAFTAFRFYMPVDEIEISNKHVVEQPLSFNTDSINTNNRASMLMNLDTNQVLYQNNIHQSIGVYSVSKVMFLATVEHHLKETNTSLDKVIEVTPIIDRVNTQTNFSSARLQSGQRFTIRELYDAVMMPSGNDATILLGDVLFGSQAEAVNAMNALAKEWGMTNSSFISTSGLDGKYLNEIGIDSVDGKNMMSVYDIVTMVRKVKENYPEIIEAGSKVVSTIGTQFNNPITLGNVNGSIEGNVNGIPGVFGLKTGSNIVPGSNAITALRHDRNGQTLLAVSIASNSRTTLRSDILSMFNYADSLDMINLQDHVHLNMNTGFVHNDIEYTIEQPFFLYVPHNQQVSLTLDNVQNFSQHLNILNVVNQHEVVGDLIINETDMFLNNEPKGLTRVVVSNQPERMTFVEKIPEFFRLLIQK